MGTDPDLLAGAVDPAETVYAERMRRRATFLHDRAHVLLLAARRSSRRTDAVLLRAQAGYELRLSATAAAVTTSVAVAAKARRTPPLAAEVSGRAHRAERRRRAA